MTQLKRIQNIFRRFKVANKIEACWWEQGQRAAQLGLSPDNLNSVQLAGYKTALIVQRERTRQWGKV